MEKERLVLKDGTEIVKGFASKSSNNNLMIHVPGNNIAQAAVNFSDPTKTAVIVCYYSIYKITYIGFTDIYSVQYFEDQDYIEIWLKPEDGVKPSMEKVITVPREYLPEDLYSDDTDIDTEEEEIENGGEHDDSGEN